MRKLVFILTVLSLTAAGATVNAATQRQITVIGTGQITAVPDMATVTLGVINEAEEASDAMAETSEAISAILEQLQDSGIADRDIQTQQFSIQPIWSNKSYDSNGSSKITGFKASNMVMIRIRDLNRLGGLLDAVIADGANNFNGLQFSVQNPDPLMEQAQKAAVADALAQAALLTSAANVSLGPVLSIQQQGGGARPMPMAAMRETSVPIAAGEVTINASVTMIFEITD